MPFDASDSTLVAQIDACLPQTQCTRCSYPRCRAYAEAIAAGEADINQCPPGGDETIDALAHLLGRSSKPLNTSYGEHTARRIAFIDESVCIGCRKCIDACPVDAILGARKWMHTVIADACTGCELCLPPCPVDCIELRPVAVPPDHGGRWPDYPPRDTAIWRERTERRLARLARRRQSRTEGGAAPTRETELRPLPPSAQIRAEIEAARKRVEHKRAANKKNG